MADLPPTLPLGRYRAVYREMVFLLLRETCCAAAHMSTVRGAIAGALKKKRLDITLQKGAGESIESQMPAEPALSIMHAAKGSGSLGGPTP
jgi:hypothetical protein